MKEEYDFSKGVRGKFYKVFNTAEDSAVDYGEAIGPNAKPLIPIEVSEKEDEVWNSYLEKKGATSQKE